MLKYRMNRPTYWLCYVLCMVVVSFLAYIGKLNGGMEMAMVLVGVPRLHDIGRSGWLVGAVIAAEIIIILAAVFVGASVDTIEFTGGVIFLSIAVLGVWLGIVPGETDANKWGEPPNAGVQFGGTKRTA